MDLSLEIQQRYSRERINAIISWVGKNPKRFALLMSYFFSEESRTAMNAAWIVSVCVERHPPLVLPWIGKMVTYAGKKNLHRGVRRSVVRSFQFASIPRSRQGVVANLCFSFLQDPKEEIAVKAFAMTVLANIVKDEPDLMHELKLVIEQMLPYGSSGILARAKKILRGLQ